MPNGNMETFRQWLPVMVIMGSIAVGWGSMNTKIDALADEVEHVKKDQSIGDRDDVTDRLKVKEVATRQEAILQDVAEVKEQLKEQDKKLDKIIEKLSERD